MTIDELENTAKALRKTAEQTASPEMASLFLSQAALFQHLADWQRRIESVKLPPMFAKMMGM